MKEEYWKHQVDIITALENKCEKIVSLKIDDHSMIIVTPILDESVLQCLDHICKKCDLCYLYKPHTIEGIQRKHKNTKPGVLWKFWIKQRV